MLKLFALTLILVSVTSRSYGAVSLVRRTEGILDFRTLDLYKFKGIPNFSELESDEKREIFHYEQTIVVRESAKDDDKVRRCEILEVYKKEEAKEILSELNKLLNVKDKEVFMDEMMDLLKNCDSVDDSIEQESKLEPKPGASTSEATSGEKLIFNGIVLGTKWCGFGDIAESYHDLGKLRIVDRCCRSHDLCPIKVLAKDKVYNLTNNAIYTKSHCRCDEAFYDCLKKDNGWTARIIGNLYFYVTHPECINGVPEKPEEEMAFLPATKMCVIRGEGQSHARINLIIDTDPGGDDAMALFLALAVPGVHVIAVTCSYGNAEVDNVVINVLKILTVTNRTDIPVFSGAKQPLTKNYTPEGYYGKDGLSDFDFDRAIEGTVDKSKHASLAMIELAKKYPGNVRILTLGPLTNVALAMSLDTSFGLNVERFYVMGGTVSEKPVVQFNFGLDPASVEIFFRTPKKTLPLIIPSDVAKKANMSKEWREKTLGALPSSSMAFLNQAERVGLEREKFWKPADSMACAATLRPELVRSKREARLTPIICGPHEGAAPVHWQGTPNAEIVQNFDSDGYRQLLMDLLA